MDFGGILCHGSQSFREVQFLSFYLLTHSCIKPTMLLPYWTSVWPVNSYGSLISFLLIFFPHTISILLIPRLVKVMCKRRPTFSLLHLRHRQHLSSHLMCISEHTGFNLNGTVCSAQSFAVGSLKPTKPYPAYPGNWSCSTATPFSWRAKKFQLEGEISPNEALPSSDLFSPIQPWDPLCSLSLLTAFEAI